MRDVRFVGARYASARAAHDFLAETLGFPDYYGHNLSALNDCLGDLSRPVHVTLDLEGIENEEMTDFCEHLVVIFERAARENPALVLDVIWPDAEE